MRFSSWPAPALLTATLLTAASGLAGCTDDFGMRSRQIKLGHVGAPSSLFAISAEEFARRANETLEGRAEVVVFGSSQLGSDETMLQKLKLGTLDLALPSTIMSSQVEAFGLFEMPYLIQDRDHMGYIERNIFWPQLAPLADEKGYKILAVWENGFRHITNSKRPIRVPDDLAGIKLRTPRGLWRVRMFKAYGADPSPMPLSEVFVALQTGVMDGQENPLAQIWSARFHEVQNCLSLTGHVYTPAYLTAGVERWSKLPEDVRKILEDTARDVQRFVYPAAEELEAELHLKLWESGIKVNEVDREAFRAASQSIYDEFSESVEGGQAMIERALELGQP